MSGPFPVLGVVSSFWSDVLQKRSEAFRNGFREALQKRSISVEHTDPCLPLMEAPQRSIRYHASVLAGSGAAVWAREAQYPLPAGFLSVCQFPASSRRRQNTWADGSFS
jgi:hypothetical protein